MADPSTGRDADAFASIRAQSQSAARITAALPVAPANTAALRKDPEISGYSSESRPVPRSRHPATPPLGCASTPEKSQSNRSALLGLLRPRRTTCWSWRPSCLARRGADRTFDAALGDGRGPGETPGRSNTGTSSPSCVETGCGARLSHRSQPTGRGVQLTGVPNTGSRTPNVGATSSERGEVAPRALVAAT